MKKWMTIFIMTLIIATLSACAEKETPKPNYRPSVKEVDEIVLKEAKASFDFFWNEANTTEGSNGYGLIPDRYPTNKDTVSSIASVGFGLTAIPIGIENGWITYEEGYERALKTLQTIDRMEDVHGFYYHFISMNTGERIWESEVSIIDTAIFINGALFSGQYFGEEIKQIATKLYKKVEWDWYFNEDAVQFYMGYKPEVGHWGAWSEYAEQLMLYVLSAGSPTHPVDKSAYYAMKFSSQTRGYEGVDPFYVSHAGTLFTYQFSHAWIDFRDYVDKAGVNWFDNSVKASEAAYLFAQDVSDRYKGVHEDSWGFSASDGPKGYVGNYGNLPSEGGQYVDGTVAPYAAIASMPFTPDYSLRAIRYFDTLEPLWGDYGFVDAFNLGTEEGYVDETLIGRIPPEGWFNQDVIGIDKGISLLMIENYRSDFVWNVFMDIDYIQDGLLALEFQKVE